MSKYLLDRALTVVLAGAVLTLEARNIKNEILECPPGAVYLWADVGDFSRFRHRRIQIDSQMQPTKDSSTENGCQGMFGQLTLAIIKSWVRIPDNYAQHWTAMKTTLLSFVFSISLILSSKKYRNLRIFIEKFRINGACTQVIFHRPKSLLVRFYQTVKLIDILYRINVLFCGKLYDVGFR